jgi:hypothetical protein
MIFAKRDRGSRPSVENRAYLFAFGGPDDFEGASSDDQTTGWSTVRLGPRGSSGYDKRVAELAAKSRCRRLQLDTLEGGRGPSYGADFSDRRAATYVVRFSRGRRRRTCPWKRDEVSDDDQP